MTAVEMEILFSICS